MLDRTTLRASNQSVRKSPAFQRARGTWIHARASTPSKILWCEQIALIFNYPDKSAPRRWQRRRDVERGPHGVAREEGALGGHRAAATACHIQAARRRERER
jgi:hypothetical protein